MWGIYSEIARTLAREGVNVVVTFKSEKGKQASEKLVKELESLGVDALRINMDLLNLETINLAIKKVLEGCTAGQ